MSTNIWWEPRIHNREKIVFSISGDGVIWYSHIMNGNGSISHTTHKKLTQNRLDLNVRPDALKTTEEDRNKTPTHEFW